MEDFSGPEVEGKDRNFVTALARGLEILRCFGENELTLTNSEISERTGLPKATISRLTHTLCALDYLVADSRDGTYRLSVSVLHLGYTALASMGIGERAKQEMRSLRDGPNSYVTVALAEQHGLDAVYLATSNSREGVSLAIRVGSRLPIFHSAIGKAILVGMTEDDRERVLDLARAESAEMEAEGRAQIAEAQAEFQAKGFCTGYGTWLSDVNGIAVPVYALAGGLVYGLNVGGPASRLKRKELETVYAPLLTQAARALSPGAA